MSSGANSSSSGDRLDGWDEIAAHLRRDKRTVQRWEQEEHLPVHRILRRKPRVWALRSELDAWWFERETATAVAEPEKTMPPVLPVSAKAATLQWLLISGVLLALLTIMIGFWYLGGNPAVAPLIVPDRIFARVEAEGGEMRSVPVRSHPVRILLSPDKERLYVLDNFGSPEIQYLSLDDFSVAGTIPIPGRPSAIVFSPDGRTLYVGTYSDGLYLVNPKTETFVKVLDRIPSRIMDLAITPDGRWLYLAMDHAGLRRFDTFTRKVEEVSTVACPEFLAIDPGGQQLFISYQCGGPGGTPAHDTVDILKLPEEKSVGILRGPPMIGGALYLFPDHDRLWVDGWDACINPDFTKYNLRGCPFIPGTIHNIFRISDRSFIRSLGAPPSESMQDPTFTPDGERAVAGGNPVRVLDTVFFEEEETFARDATELLCPQFDPQRRRLYLAGLSSGKIYAVDLPMGDCAPSLPGLVHHWAGDGTATDRSHSLGLRWLGPAAYWSGLVGKAFRLQESTLEAETDYEWLNSMALQAGTLCLWMKPFAEARGGVVAEFRWKDKLAWRLGVTEDFHLTFEQPGLPDLRSHSRLRVGVWQYVTLARSQSDVSVYLDGRLDFNAPRPIDTKSIGLRFKSLRFGAVAALLDEIVLYDRTLTSSDLFKLMHAAVCAANSPAHQ